MAALQLNQALRLFGLHREQAIGVAFNSEREGSEAPDLGDHFKSGQQLSLQNRPTEVAVQD